MTTRVRERSQACAAHPIGVKKALFFFLLKTNMSFKNLRSANTTRITKGNPCQCVGLVAGQRAYSHTERETKSQRWQHLTHRSTPTSACDRHGLSLRAATLRPSSDSPDIPPPLLGKPPSSRPSASGHGASLFLPNPNTNGRARFRFGSGSGFPAFIEPRFHPLSFPHPHQSPN